MGGRSEIGQELSIIEAVQGFHGNLLHHSLFLCVYLEVFIIRKFFSINGREPKMKESLHSLPKS